MQAIILAAGMGKRLQELTKNNTKCMVRVNGETLAERLLRMLDRKNLSRIVIVVGYEGAKLIDYIATIGINTPIEYIDNPIYDKTNNIYSLALAKDYLVSEDTLLFESDLIFEESCIDALLEDPRETLALVDKYKSWMDGTCMVLDEEDCIVDFVPGKYLDYSLRDTYYKTVNIYKFSKHFSKNTYVPFLEAYKKAMGVNEYYESVIKLIAMLDTKEIRAKRLSGQIWYEIDDVQDLDIAESLFPTDDSNRYDLIMKRYGGFWRYPALIDFCYLVNPYYPSEQMKNEMKASFDTLLTEYPSGMGVNSLLASRNFGVRQEHIVVGNGAAELIKGLMEAKDWGVLGLVRPTFEEYPHRYTDDKCIEFISGNRDYYYTADDIINHYCDKNINTFLLINPDNPSGNYINRAGLDKLISWAKTKDINLIIDESFVDFADEDNASLICEEVITSYEKLYVMKSISKSYGVPGIRLGILVSGDADMISLLKKDVAIWNINSFGEFFMQIYEKYEKVYKASLIEIRGARERLFNNLSKVEYLRPIPSQANYIMCEVISGCARDICEKALKENILIKDLSNKMNGEQFIRIAVRNDEDNEVLINTLMKIRRYIPNSV